MRLALTIEYEGTHYHGFQYQVNAPSIQGELEQAIERLTGERVRVKGAGRTDAGVHAEAQVVVFDTSSDRSTQTFVNALNHYLPQDIAVKQAHIVQAGFRPTAKCAETHLPLQHTELWDAVTSDKAVQLSHSEYAGLEADARSSRSVHRRARLSKVRGAPSEGQDEQRARHT